MSETTLNAELSALIASLSPSSRRKLMRVLSIELRRRQSKRIGQQKNPDGSAYIQRKQLRDKHGRLRDKMFNKLRTARYMKAENSEHEAAVSFTPQVMNLANVHQYGLRDRVSVRGPEVKYASRTLLGFESQDIDWISDKIIAHLAE